MYSLFVKEIKSLERDTSRFASSELEKWRDNLYSGSDYFFYNLFDVGYVSPESILDDESVEKVYNAMNILEEFRAMFALCEGEK